MYSPFGLRRGGRSHSRRLVALMAALLLGVSLVAAAPSTATTSTEPDSRHSAATPAADFASLPADVEPVAVTLITGDTVLWRDTGDGQAGVAEIEEAPRDVPVYFDQSGTVLDFHVIPSDAMPYVVSGALDMELFNIPSLVRQGLDDESTGGELPVIVTFDEDADAKQLERDADALPAAREAQGVEGIKGAGVKVDRGNAAKFRDTVLGKPDKGKIRGFSTNSQSDSLPGAVDKILLDQILEIDLAESVPQIGAPQAWEAGFTGEGVTVAVLDTGVDATHPDLVGQVVVAENFVGQGDPIDDHGHGTHVAATIAGTGAASDGARKGVAPDAELLSGKVCTADSECPTSAIMAGMEWAADQGADIVNMSLGSPRGTGTSPLEQLINDLSAETDTLFVTSAGNSGGAQTVGSPGAADAALAVGAVDKTDHLAGFSSRGPRIGDHAVKPEITAPGVGIVAARAEGTDIGSPVDDLYASLNGTSMAAPHVAGAAALLAQAQPDLHGQELKDALVSTATPVDAPFGGLWWEVGTGRVDVPASLDSPVYAQGTVNFGHVTDRAEQNLTYTNHGDTDVTLDLDPTVTGTSGEPLDVVSLSADTLTVPAGGQASVTVAIDITGVSDRENLFGGGIVTATAEGVNLRSAIGFGPIRHTVTVEVLDSHGDRIGTDSARDERVYLVRDTLDPSKEACCVPTFFEASGGVATGQVRSGTYTIMTMVTEADPDTGHRLRSSGVVKLEVVIDSDTTITLDARDAVPIERPEVPREVDERNHRAFLSREGPEVVLCGGCEPETIDFILDLGGADQLYVTPTPPGELKHMRLGTYWLLAEPLPVHPIPVVGGSCVRAVNPLPFQCYSEAPAYIYNLPFVYENGIPDDLQEKVTHRDLVEIPSRYHSDQPDDVLINHQFGAYTPFRCGGSCGGNGASMWFQPGETTEYFLADDRITWSRFAAAQHQPEGEPYLPGSFQPRSTDWFPAVEAGTQRAEEHWLDGPLRVGIGDLREEFLSSPRGDQLFPGYATASRGGIDGNLFIPGFQVLGNTRGQFAGPNRYTPSFASWRIWNLDTGAELEPVEIAPVSLPGVPYFRIGSDEATYRLEQIEEYPLVGLGRRGQGGVGELFRTGPATTTWGFTSRPSDAQVPVGYECVIVPSDVCQIQPLIQLEYQLGLDLHNRAKAGRAHRFTINAGHHSKAIDRARVTDLSVQASFDDGQTWTDARVIGKVKDSWDTGGLLPSAEPYQEYQVVVKMPPLGRTNGYVALRVEAEDANGGTIDQTVHRAFQLK